MSYVGDFALEKTFDTKFCTVTTTGAPTVLAGSPVISAYVGNSTAQITAGITLTVDFDSVVGLNNVRVVATAANGYAAGGNYQLVITAGTVGGTSVVGYVVAEFSIEARSSLRPTTADRTLDVSTGGEAGLDWANIGSPTTAQNLSATNIDVDQVVASVTAIVTANVTQLGGVAQSLTDLKDFADDGYDPATNKVQGVVLTDTVTTYTGNTLQTGDSFARIGATGSGLTTLATQASVNTVDDFLDTEILAIKAVTDALPNAGALTTIQSDLDDIQTRLPAALTAGISDSGTTTTMVDAARTEADTDYWKGSWIRFTSGNISGQVRLITGFTPATDTITFAPATTQAVATQTYEILPANRIDLGQWLGSTPNALVSSRVDVSVGAMATDVLTAASLNADAVTEIQAGLATAAALDAVDNFVDTEIAAIITTLGTPAGASISADILVIDNLVDDLESRVGTPSNLGSGATVAANLVDIEGQTDDIGTAGAGLTAIPWNVAWDAEVQSEVDDAIVARNLDKLVIVSGTADSGSTTTMVDAARTEADADYWKGRLLLFTSGNISGQCAIITDFVVATDTFTFAPPLTQAVATQTYVILPSISVWDDTLAEHLISGSTGAALNAAGAAGDPWTTALPGAYGAGSAGKIIGDNVNGTILSRASQVTLDALDDLVDTEIGTIISTLGTPAGASVSADILVIDNLVDDLESRMGTPSNLGSGATVAANLVDIEAQTDDIGAAGAGLTALATAAALATVQADTDNIQTRLPAALVSGRMDSNMQAAANGVITALVIATDAINSDALATNAVTEIQNGLATAAALTVIDDFLDTEITTLQADVSAILADTGTDGVIVAAASKTGYALSAAGVDEIFDELRAGHNVVGSYGESFFTIESGAAIAGTLSTTQMSTNLTEATDDHYNGRILIFTSGALLRQATDITAYNGTTKVLTFTALTEAPTVADKFIIV